MSAVFEKTARTSPRSNQRVLVVGANGQVGRALLRELGNAALPAGRTAQEPGWIECDLARIAADPNRTPRILEPLELAAVFCVGGATDVERCESDPGWATAVNCDGPAALAYAARAVPFVFFSTDYVFDGVAGPYDEQAIPHPLSVYGRSKLAGEQRVLEAHPDTLVVRTTTVFGPDAQRKNFLYTLNRLLSAGTPMRVAKDQLSNPTYNEDLARATVALVAAGKTGIYNVAGPSVMSRYEFAVKAAGLLGLDSSLLQPVATEDLKQHAARPLSSGLVIEKLQHALGVEPMRSVTDAIQAWKEKERASCR